MKALIIASLFLGSFATVATPAVAQEAVANVDVAAVNTARDYIVANHFNALEAAGVSLEGCVFRTVADAETITVYVMGDALAATIVLDALELDVLDATVSILGIER